MPTTNHQSSPEEYLEFERKAELKHEYIDGRIIPWFGATLTHCRIMGNLLAALHLRFRGGPCQVYASQMRVEAAGGRSYLYPDIVAACAGKTFIGDVRDTLTNPVLVMEVLSPDTEAFDRGEKFHHYQTIETLQEYILIAQDQPRVECYKRGGEDVWFLWTETNLDAEVDFFSVDCRIPLCEIYEDVEFPSVADAATVSAP
jgi:Uma2 family endonuclease